MVTTTRLFTLTTLFALHVGLTMVQQADAAPFRPRPFSETERLAAKSDCQLGGGQQFETVYHYEYGGGTPTSATTTCHGGTNDGQTCTISGSSKQCTSAIVVRRGTVDVDGAEVIERL